LFPISIYNINNNNDYYDYIDNNKNIIYIITGICSQVYTIIRIFIITTKERDGNKIVVGLDLLRRIIMNIVSYIYFEENFNILILFSNIFMLFGCFIFLLL